MKYINKSIKTYLNDLASGKPAPGGGSAAALTASSGVSLLLMAANFTTGKRAFEDREKLIKSVIKELSAIKKKLEALIDEDVAAYGKLARILKMPKSPARKKLLEKALRQAAGAPYKICGLSRDAMAYAPILMKKGNPNLLTDVECGALILESAFRAAKINVNINLLYMKDKAFIGKLRKDIGQMERTINGCGVVKG